ncbi:MAG: response regulator [Phycisphaerae bacterium]|nr:response regulator [Phycisphaerae bacterium]
MNPAVLIVDDSLTVRMDLGESFESAGFERVLCSSLAEARDALVAHPFDLIVLDVLLPDGNGIDFLRELRTISATANTPVVMLSTEAEIRDRVRGLKTGASDYIGKPYESAYVVGRSLELLRKTLSAGESRGSTTVLVIDDSATFREELKFVLETSGYRVIAAVSGEDGLRAAVDARPDIIVVDGVLPGIDGATVIRRIRADAAIRATPCILLTASEERSGELEALDAGADAYVRKEEDSQVILARVTAVLRASAASFSAVAAPASLLGPKKILVVEDDAGELGEIAGELRHEGCEVIGARSGNEALELLSVQLVDCILLGMKSSVGSVFETCKRIKSTPEWRGIPLIVHAPADTQQAMVDGINAGADDYIVKSSDLAVLRARVRAQLRRKQFEDENRGIRERFLQKELEVVAANSARELAEARASFVEELERKNAELEAFSYSVSHDLRAPLRSIDGFSQLLLEECAETLNAKGQDYLKRVRASAQRMGNLIDDLLQLSRVGRAAIHRDRIDLSAIANAVVEELRTKDPERKIAVRVQERLLADADLGLVRIVFDNLLGNAWKFTMKAAAPRIDVEAKWDAGAATFCVRDNGAGFSMEYAESLFRPFQRLHSDADFPGTGIGLATVHRIIDRHGGRIWAESAVDQGAAFYFTLPVAKATGRA